MQARMAISAPVLRPAFRIYASALQDSRAPFTSQPQTLMVRVLVLLIGGMPPSLMTMGSRYKSCFCRLNPPRRAYTPAVLSVGRGETGVFCYPDHSNHICTPLGSVEAFFLITHIDNSNLSLLFFNLSHCTSHHHLSW